VSAPIRRIDERTFQFSCDILRFCRSLAASPGVNRHVAHQLLRSATSVGANAQEAKGALTRREFACKYALVLREARESLFWLRLIHETNLTSDPRVPDLIGEADQLVAILTVSVRRAREPHPTDRP
jgi:four helix bundle protein